MSDEKGHPQRMPDPGTPFPILGSGQIQFGYSDGKYTVGTTQATPAISRSYVVPSGAETSKFSDLTGHAHWAYYASTSEDHALVYVGANTQSAFSSALEHVAVRDVQASGTSGLQLTIVQNNQTVTLTATLSNAAARQRFLDLWDAGGGSSGGPFVAGFGKEPAGTGAAWVWQDAQNQGAHLVLGLQLTPA